MIRAVLFDVGGVLHTSEADPNMESYFAEASIKTLKDQGVDLPVSPGEFIKIINIRAREYKKHSEADKRELSGPRIWSEFFLRDFDISPETLAPCAEKLCYLFDARRTRLVPRPNLPRTVEELHAQGIKLGVVSNIISTTFVPERLKLYNVASYMDCVVTSSETGIRKPAPEIFLIAADRLRLSPGECAYVGDRISRDIIGSHNAGIGLAILIRYPPSEKKDAAFVCAENEPDYRIDDLGEIPAIIENANRGDHA
ncbi:MAG: HAD-IA family hydrolase [Treponema sp.]|jgi:putative hydrolase of the HAD superfamily|nr:HAD-IA family hydrolase [Treponema sp.]